MKFDLHNHTHYSHCSTFSPLALLKLAKKTGLDGIAVTDHNTVKGGLTVKKLNRDKDFKVIMGSERYTSRGHVLGLFLQKDIKSKVYEEVIEEIRNQGGVSIIAHPFRYLPGAFFRMKGLDHKYFPDAIECFNSRTAGYANAMAGRLADRLQSPKTAGSDTHFPFELGKCYTSFDGDCREAILKRKTAVFGKSYTMLVGGTLSFLAKTTHKLGLRTCPQ
ncbi:PHP domain-containing protein [Candidatus Woesearchaeota archaeon]|nr:PHP domain-containing protein [Candidatus Woesearchaeota archaeon]